MTTRPIQSFADCISERERKQRFKVTFVNIIIWLLLVIVSAATWGVFLIVAFAGWAINSLLAEYNVRKLQAIGATVSRTQLPEVHGALESVCQRFNVPNTYRVIIIPSGTANAFAMKFARKRVVVILSELLAGIIDDPAELRALLGHELCHSVLDHGMRGIFERYKPVQYKAARELTCDNAGLIAANDLEAAKTLIRKLCVTRHLHLRLSDDALVEESKAIYSGISGWLIKQYMSHPPAGSRLLNLEEFSQTAMLSPARSIATVPA